MYSKEISNRYDKKLSTNKNEDASGEKNDSFGGLIHIFDNFRY